ncbi:MAG: arginine--tRNA ligase [Nanoarchaeota archaeon]|nr:arginine--tRNA ligase [Nanoarchaeota archaeon]MBU1103001.1 arginine--tRNA ligase [Nanoarchaeota archaeon]
MKEKTIALLTKQTNLSKKEIEKLLEVPPSPELGDYAFPCFLLSKKLKQNPNQIASNVVGKIKKSKEFEKIEARGPYINFFINRRGLAEKTLGKIQKEKGKYGSAKLSSDKVMIEFSQPNTHKAFHVGHVRGTSLGESISRILELAGNKVVRANYSGDTGMHIAKWLWCYKKYHSKAKLKDDESWIAGIYVDAIKKLKENLDLQEEVDEVNRQLESRSNKELNELWKKTRTASIKSWEKIYKELNTKFDVHYFESEVEKPAKLLAKELVKKKIAKISEGATVVDFKDFNAENLGVFLLLRKDGTVLYGGKDMSLAERKFKEFKLDKSYYIIGREQDLYFQQVFKTFELMKSKAAGKSFHIMLSEVRLPTGKMSSRSGENILYSDFKNELVDYAKIQIKKRHKTNEKELSRRALAIAIASMKYAMLKQDANRTIIFNKEEAMKFEGNTGPYLLYTYARARNILKKAKKTFSKKVTAKKIKDIEKILLSKLSSFPDIVARSYAELAPSLIANYAYQLAKTFNEFYHSQQVINSQEEDFRLSIVEAFSQVLKNSLNLLGIETLEEM